MRKRPEIPEDVFFNVTPDEAPQTAAPKTAAEEPEPEDDVLAKSMGEESSAHGPSFRLPDARRQRETERAPTPESDAEPPRVGRPPAQKGPKVAVTLYLTEPVAYMLEEVKYLLLTEYNVRTSKSAIADFAMRHGLRDLQAVADDLRRD